MNNNKKQCQKGQQYSSSPHIGSEREKSIVGVSMSPKCPSSSSASSGSPGFSASGSYKNKSFTIALSALIGCNIVIQTQNGSLFDGILTAWSPNVDIVLEQVHQIDPKNYDREKYIDPSKVKAKMIFPISTIEQCKAIDVDLD